MTTKSGFEDIIGNIPTDGPQAETLESFDDDFIALGQLGYLSDTVHFCGHSFGLRTLNHAEEVAAAKLIKLAEDTSAQFKVSIGAIVAAAITTINGEPWIPNILGMDEDSHVARRYKKLGDFAPPLVEFLFQELAKLNLRRDEQLKELQKKFSGDIRISSGSPDPSTDKDSSTIEG